MSGRTLCDILGAGFGIVILVWELVRVDGPGGMTLGEILDLAGFLGVAAASGAAAALIGWWVARNLLPEKGWQWVRDLFPAKGVDMIVVGMVGARMLGLAAAVAIFPALAMAWIWGP